MRTAHLKSALIALLCSAVTMLAACGNSGAVPGGGNPAAGVPGSLPAKVGHVFVVVLENEDFTNSFGGTAAPFLATTLPARGALLQNYYGTGHVSLDNYLSMISGQGANPVTQSDCQFFVDFIGTGPQAAQDQQAVGSGCVYPASVPNLTDQLKAAGRSWKGYMEDMGNDPARGVASTCGHPALNAQDKTQTASATDSYATRHNPFMYFHSIIDDQPYCDAHVVNLTRLDADLASVATTPEFSFITPSLCHDGHDSPCANGENGGLLSVNDFLAGTPAANGSPATVGLVERITRSPAFQKDGLLIITFDESNGPQSDSTACCGNASVNSPAPGIFGMGGGRVGAVLLSPFIKPGTVSTKDYSHYSMLRTIEDLFGLPYLGYAGQSTQSSFGADVFTAQLPVFPPKQP